MDEYIKRDKALAETWKEPRYTDVMNVLTEIRDRIRSLPSEDVQPVVRCSECEHWNEGTCYCDDYEIHCQDYYIGDMHTEPDFFCGFGKRKGADNEVN